LASVLLLAACGGPPSPWPTPPTDAIDLELAVSATEVHLLEPVVVQLDLYRRADLEVEFAPEVDAADFLVEKQVLPEIALGDGRWRHTTLVLRPVRGPAELVLPSFVARAKDGSLAASTPERTITVLSSLADQGAAIEAPGAPFPPPSRLLWWLAGAGALVLLLGLGFVAWRRRRRPLPHREAVALPPHVKAQRALARLRTAPRTTPAQVETFYVGVSDVLRTYLEERFGLRAPERTTEEFLRDLEGGDQLAREHRAELERFLQQCDLVKFAAAVPAEADHLAMFALAEAFVATTAGDRRAAEASA
jgi:hypothetical protein